MKRTDNLTKIIVCLLFIAVAAYLGVYLYNSTSDRMTTAQASFSSVTTGGAASGIIVRQEEVLSSSEQYIDITVADGSRVGVGQNVATAMNSEQALQRAARVHELELEISRLSALLGNIDSASDITTRDKNITNLLLSLTSSIARGELDGLDSVSLNLSSLLFTSSGSGATQSELVSRQNELQSLKVGTAPDTKEITTETSGTFSKALDGYEDLSPSDLENLTPTKLNEMLDGERQAQEHGFGKIVTSYSWYFASVMSSANAALLEAGSTAYLDFGRYYSGTIKAEVILISAPEAGDRVVVFRCDSALAETLNLRTVSAEVAFDSYAGIRIPAQALINDEANETLYVYVVTAMQLERKDVEVIYSESDYVLVAKKADPDALREGNTVVVSGEDLFEGKVLK